MNIKTLPVNEKGRDFVVGDLHGCRNLFDRFLAHMDFDTTTDRVISVGDIVDRGPESLKTLHLLNFPWFHAVKGNHEDLMCMALQYNTDILWSRNGGQWAGKLEVSELTHLTGYCKDVVSKLPAVITVPNVDGTKFHVVHAELGGEVQLTDDTLEANFWHAALQNTREGPWHMWARDIFDYLCLETVDDRLLKKYARGSELEKRGFAVRSSELSTVYCGHSPVYQPTKCWNMVNIDTGAYKLYSPNTPKKTFGLTFAEPSSGKFWTVTPELVKEVELLVVI